MISQKRMSIVLRSLGISPSLKGFDYIMTALTLIDENESYRYRTCDLYDKIAAVYDISRSKCERCMRVAADTVFKNADYSVIKAVFGRPLKNKPTNSEFLACLYEYLRYER